MNWSRRQFLTAATGLPFAADALSAADADKRKRLGVVLYSYAIRLSADRAAGKAGFSDPLAFLEHCHELGAGGVQTGIGVRDKEYLTRLRQKLETYDMYLEGSIRLPKDRADCERLHVGGPAPARPARRCCAPCCSAAGATSNSSTPTTSAQRKTPGSP